jgi:hypothetical protein
LYVSVQVPAGWRRHTGANVIVLDAPEGEGRIRCRLRVRLAPLSRVIADVLEPARWTVVRTRVVITDEGEYGAISHVAVEGEPAPRLVGVVFGDDFAVVLDAKTHAAHAASMVEATLRELLLRSSLGLGVRRRRYYYESPVGWRAVPNGLVATWHPPGFPDDAAQLVVLPAEPFVADPEAELARLIDGASIVTEIKREAIETASGLVGHCWSFAIRDRGRTTTLASVTRAPYRYAMWLETEGDERYRDVFTATVASISPLPPPGQGAIDSPTSLSALGHWAE